MKNSDGPQSATSLPRAPRDEVSARSTRYLITMGIRVACFILMVVITPYGWYTWVFAAGAIFLPYIAVVMANVGQDGRRADREDPERALPAPPPASTPDSATGVIRVQEQRLLADGSDAATPTTPPDEQA